MREIIGLTGAIRAGKTETANILTAINPNKHAHYETGGYVSKVGDNFNTIFRTHKADKDIERVNKTLLDLDFKKLFRATLQINSAKLLFDEDDMQADPTHYDRLAAYMQNIAENPSLLDQPIAEGDKNLYRPLLEWLGNHFVTKVNPHIWFKEIFYDVQRKDKDKELIIVGGVRYPEDATFVRSNGTETKGRIVEIERPGHEVNSNSPSEIRRREIKADIRLINNGTINDLGDICLRFYNDLNDGQLQKVYRTLPLRKAA